MTPEPEIEEWRKAWSSVDDGNTEANANQAIAAAIRYQRRSHFALAANISFAALLLGASLAVTRRAPSREMVLWNICVWMTTLIASFLAVEGWRKSRVENIERVSEYIALHRKRAIVDQWKVRTGVGFLVVQILIAGVWLTTDLMMARIRWARFGTAMVVVLTISGIWVYVFAQMWGRSKAILDSTSADD